MKGANNPNLTFKFELYSNHGRYAEFLHFRSNLDLYWYKWDGSEYVLMCGRDFIIKMADYDLGMAASCYGRGGIYSYHFMPKVFPTTL